MELEPRPIQHTVAAISGATCLTAFVGGWCVVGVPFGLALLLHSTKYDSVFWMDVVMGWVVFGLYHAWFRWIVPAFLRGENFERLRTDRLPNFWLWSGFAGLLCSAPIAVVAWPSLT
jgi:hypothetical protein